MKKKTMAICILIAAIIAVLVLKDNLLRSYVSLCHEKLESYALQMLDSTQSTEGNYGMWKTSSYPDEGVVEFRTGGWGLAPSSTYKGFYYSADNTHKLFSAAYKDKTSIENDGDHATWTDGTDNHGSSTRIIDKWFWFEASF